MDVDLLQDPVDPSALARMLACVDREIGLRMKVYPRWVAAGKLSGGAAMAELEQMRLVRAQLVRGGALEEFVATLAAAHLCDAEREVARLEAHYARLYPPPAAGARVLG